MKASFVRAFALLLLASPAAYAQTADAVGAPGETVIATMHAEGAQVYECKADPAGKPAWRFREPIATLLVDGKTVGRHYAGPSWELDDGAVVKGKVAANAPGATPNDIPLLKLDAASQNDKGAFAGATTIQRLRTKGGVVAGSCEPIGAFLNVPYSAEYVFLKKAK